MGFFSFKKTKKRVLQLLPMGHDAVGFFRSPEWAFSWPAGQLRWRFAVIRVSSRAAFIQSTLFYFFSLVSIRKGGGKKRSMSVMFCGFSTGYCLVVDFVHWLFYLLFTVDWYEDHRLFGLLSAKYWSHCPDLGETFRLCWMHQANHCTGQRGIFHSHYSYSMPYGYINISLK